MTLKEITELYDGEITVDVNKVDKDTGGIIDVIKCSILELVAIKDDIMDATIIKFDVKVDKGVPVIELFI